jgi:hypothetical protein
MISLFTRVSGEPGPGQASAVDGATLKDNLVPVGFVAFFMLLAAGFVVAALGPRALKARFWMLLPDYAAKEQELADANAAMVGACPESAEPDLILASWRARRALSSYLAERKALWLTCALICLLLAFISTGVAALVIVS